MRASRQKTTAFFAVVCLSVRSSFERGILRADESSLFRARFAARTFSPLWRQTANNSASWRLICVSRARSRAGARLGRASRACSPPTCTILRRLIKLVWASLHLSERSRTIEVRVTTLSAQTCTKSLTQSYYFLPIELLVISRVKPKNGPRRTHLDKPT